MCEHQIRLERTQLKRELKLSCRRMAVCFCNFRNGRKVVGIKLTSRDWRCQSSIYYDGRRSNKPTLRLVYFFTSGRGDLKTGFIECQKSWFFFGGTELCRSVPVCAGLCRSVPVCADLCRSVPVCAGPSKILFYLKISKILEKFALDSLDLSSEKGEPRTQRRFPWKNCTRKMTKAERGTREVFGIFRVLRPKITGKFITIF